jgi:hypothetical protein
VCTQLKRVRDPERSTIRPAAADDTERTLIYSLIFFFFTRCDLDTTFSVAGLQLKIVTLKMPLGGVSVNFAKKDSFSNFFAVSLNIQITC